MVTDAPDPPRNNRLFHSASDFDESYLGTPPWEIGRPQPAFVDLAESAQLRGRVLDAGCGTGEHVLMAASRGFEATGIDFAPRAIEAALRKAGERGITARLVVGDALHLEELGGQFDTVLDSGLFHTFDDVDRRRYVESLQAATAPGGHVFVCCFSDREPGDWGPRRVTGSEITAAFDAGWEVRSIEPSQFVLSRVPASAEAWMATVARV